MRSRPERWELFALALILAAFATFLVSLAWKTGVTVDEPSHLLSAHLYWLGQDTLAPGDMPPAIKILGGWVTHLTGLPIPRDKPEVWNSQHEWNISLEMMSRMNQAQIHNAFFYSRLPLLFFPLACALLVWHWGRQLFSPITGLLMAGVFSLSPTVLGHGCLFKNDLAASFSYLLFWYCAWRFWREPLLRNAALLAAALLLALLSKFSLLVLIPIAPAIILARFLTLRPISNRLAAISLVIVFTIPYAGVLAAWQFRAGPMKVHQVAEWEADPVIPKPLAKLASITRHLPSPQRLRDGVVSLFHSNADGTGVFLLGKVFPKGHPLYFLVTLALKIPIPLQFTILAGAGLAFFQLLRRQRPPTDLFWLLPPLLYLFFASLSSLQLGFRLILPAHAFLFLFTGCTLEWFRPRRFYPAVPVLVILWLSVRVVQEYPHYISYFNRWAGGSDNADTWLTDSNLDWGQDLPAFAEWVNTNKPPKIRLAYFGTDNPYAYLSDRVLETLAPPWSPDLVGGQTRMHPQPGYYAISTTLLTGQLFAEPYRDYFAEFRKIKPIAKAGYSIFIYRIGDPAQP